MDSDNIPLAYIPYY